MFSQKIVCALFLLLFSFVSNADDEPSKLVSDFYRSHKSTSEQMRHFKEYSIQDQYELFEFGNRVVHPPATYLALPFAEQGAVIIPFLKEKLETTKDETTIRDIALIYSKVAHLKLYDFSKDPELLKLLNQKIGSMQGIWKDITVKSLAEIQAVH